MPTTEEVLQKIRQAKKLQYTQLRQEEKPKLPTCPDCRSYSHLTAICPATGKRHDLDRKKLIGGFLVEKDCRSFVGETLRDAITLDRVKWQPQRTKLVRVDTMAIHIFQSFVASLNWNVHRFGILYGTYDPEERIMEVHAIYEPPAQHGNAFSFEEVERDTPEGQKAWEEEQRVNRLAEVLGMRRVGVVCTHPAELHGAIISARELLRVAQEQSIYGDECVLLTVAAPSPVRTTTTTTSSNISESSRGRRSAGGSSSAGSPTATDSSVDFSTDATASHCEAWQASEQCVRLYQMNVLSESPWEEAKGTGGGGSGSGGGRRLLSLEEEQKYNPAGSTPLPSRSSPPENGTSHVPSSSSSSMARGTSGSVWSRIHLELAEEKRNPTTGKMEFQTFESSNEIDLHWFTSCVAVERFDSPYFTNAFMRRRVGFGMPTGKNLKQYWSEPKREHHTFVEKVSDFQVLLFLLDALGEEAMVGKRVTGGSGTGVQNGREVATPVAQNGGGSPVGRTLGEPTPTTLNGTTASSLPSSISHTKTPVGKGKKEEETASRGWAGVLRKLKGIPSMEEKSSGWWEGKIGDRMCSPPQSHGSPASELGGSFSGGSPNTMELPSSLMSDDFEELKKFAVAVREVMKKG